MANPPGDDRKAWDETYDDNTYVILALVLDGQSAKLKVKFKVEEDAWFWAKKEGRAFVFDFGLGDEEYEEDQVPRPLRKLIASRGGGPDGNSVKLPPKSLLVDGYRRRTYAQYASMWNSRGRRPEEKLPPGLFVQLANMYLRAMGVPAYL